MALAARSGAPPFDAFQNSHQQVGTALASPLMQPVAPMAHGFSERASLPVKTTKFRSRPNFTKGAMIRKPSRTLASTPATETRSANARDRFERDCGAGPVREKL